VHPAPPKGAGGTPTALPLSAPIRLLLGLIWQKNFPCQRLLFPCTTSMSIPCVHFICRGINYFEEKKTFNAIRLYCVLTASERNLSTLQGFASAGSKLSTLYFVRLGLSASVSAYHRAGGVLLTATKKMGHPVQVSINKSISQ
jgi:hypothetical protein